MGSGGSLLRHRGLSSALAFVMAMVTFVVASTPQIAQAANFSVDQNDGTCNAAGPVYCTINEALAVATTPGDVVQVAPGVYAESIFISSQTVTIESTGGAAVTTIQAPAAETSVVTVNVGTLTLVGFTVTGASRTSFSNAAGIMVNNVAGTVTVRDSVITNNSTTVGRGGWFGRFWHHERDQHSRDRQLGFGRWWPVEQWNDDSHRFDHYW